MLLAREFIAYLSRQLVKRLTPGVIETPNPDSVAQKIAEVITQELAVEDRLNDEVRDLLSQYSDYMRRESVSYQEMFRRIKNTLISQRKVIRASGRDSGDNMKLSRDKVTDMSHRIVEMLRKSHDLRLKHKDPNNVRLEILRHMTELLMAEDIASVYLVNDSSLIQTEKLQRAIADAVEAVAKRALPESVFVAA